LHNETGERWFVYEEASPECEANCLCFWEYTSTFGALYAAIRWTLVSAVFLQPSSAIKRAGLQLYGAKIHKTAYLSSQVYIDPLFPSLLTVEENAILGLGTRIALHEQTGERFRAGRVRICRGATIGAFSQIASGVTIGEYARVGFGSVVLRDVPPYAIAIGNPARVVSRIDPASSSPIPARDSK
jgi:acetyltransferase-like isoleucine patch superfamily enzyme